MLINYAIFGNIDINDELVIVNYNIRNLTNNFTSEEFTSEIGYYNINLGNFPNNVFNDGDVLVITFYSRHNGIDYKSIMYTVVDVTKDISNINTTLISDWDYESYIKVTNEDGVVDISFVTTYYKTILFKLYIKYKNSYKEIDTAMIDSQTIKITFQHNGLFKIVGYVTDDNKLLSYSSKEFVIDSVESENSTGQLSYLEWE